MVTNRRTNQMKQLQMSNRRSQLGLSIWAWSGVLLVVLLAATVSLKLAPIYFEYLMVVDIAKDIKNEAGAGNKKARLAELQRKVAKRFRANNIRNISYTVLSFKRGASGLIVTIDYEQRVNVIANVDAVLVFNRQID